MFAQAIETILNDHCTAATVRAIESGASAEALTGAIEDAGFFELLTPEQAGGGGATLRDLHAIAVLCGAHAVPIPLVQTLAARLLVRSPDDLPRGLMTLACSAARDAAGAIRAPFVPASRTAAHVIVALDDALLLLPTAQAERSANGIHGSLADSLRWNADAGRTLAGRIGAHELRPLAALLHAAMLAGAMKRAFDMSLNYCNERMQFGKSIGKFQAIQHQLSVMAQQVAAASIAAQAAFHCATAVPSAAACAVAKARTSEAAQQVAAIAHAVHGAIGITEEYDLQLYTRRLHEWRIAHGSEVYWNRQIGSLLLRSDQSSMADFVRTLFECPGPRPCCAARVAR